MLMNSWHHDISILHPLADLYSISITYSITISICYVTYYVYLIFFFFYSEIRVIKEEWGCVKMCLHYFKRTEKKKLPLDMFDYKQPSNLWIRLLTMPDCCQDLTLHKMFFFYVTFAVMMPEITSNTIIWVLNYLSILKYLIKYLKKDTLFRVLQCNPVNILQNVTCPVF